MLAKRISIANIMLGSVTEAISGLCSTLYSVASSIDWTPLERSWTSNLQPTHPAWVTLKIGSLNDLTTMVKTQAASKEPLSMFCTFLIRLRLVLRAPDWLSNLSPMDYNLHIKKNYKLAVV